MSEAKVSGGMKSAEEWSKDFWQRDFNGPTEAVHDCFMHFFREIQSDAFAAGQQSLMRPAGTLYEWFQGNTARKMFTDGQLKALDEIFQALDQAVKATKR